MNEEFIAVKQKTRKFILSIFECKLARCTQIFYYSYILQLRVASQILIFLSFSNSLKFSGQNFLIAEFSRKNVDESKAII